MLKLRNLIAFVYWLCCCCCCCCVFPSIESKHVDVNTLAITNLKNYMDITARPCENFYQYACGNWAHHQNFDNDQLYFGDTLGLLDYELNRKLEHILKKLPNNSSQDEEALNSSVYHKVRIYYKSCKKVKPYNLKKYLQLVHPGFEVNWAVLQRSHGNGGRYWKEEKFDWLETISKLRLYGLNGVLLKEEVLPRWDDSSSNSIYLDKPNLAETMPMGEGPMIELMLDIGQTKREANRIAREVNIFEERLQRLQEVEDDEGPKEMQLSYLQQYMDQIDWFLYLKQLRGPATELDITVIIQNVPYMRELVKLLERTPREILCHYIMLKFLQFLKQRGPAEISKTECITSLRRAMPLALNHIVGEHFYRDQQANDATVKQIFKRLRKKFRLTLVENRLQLQPPIVKALLDKVDKIRLQIGNVPRNVTSSFYDDFYEHVELDPNNFYANQLSLLRLAVEKSHEQLEVQQPSSIGLSESEIQMTIGDEKNVTSNVTTNSIQTSMASNTTNGSMFGSYILYDWLGSSSSPLYIKPHNLIIVPYGFLQMPVYHRQMKDVLKYSALGFIIAHELMHAFDSSGIDYDSVGNIMGPSEEIAGNQRFMNGLRCMQNELATGSRLNEKLADYEGIRLAYEAYFHRLEGKSKHTGIEEKRFDLLPEFTNKQIFFINFAQFFCGKVHPRVGQAAIMEHALDELRVLQTLANFEEFSAAFDCDRRAKMQSRNRCLLW